MEQPQTKAAAEKEKWVEVPKPEIHEEFSSLTLMCPTDCDYTLCLFYDDTDNVAGLQIAVCIIILLLFPEESKELEIPLHICILFHEFRKRLDDLDNIFYFGKILLFLFNFFSDLC